MKKILAGVLGAMIASSSMAAISFNFGTNFFKPAIDNNGLDEYVQGQGQTFAIDWAFSDDTFLGYYNEEASLNNSFGNSYLWIIEALQVGKTVMKGVNVGLNIGTFYESWRGETGLVTDVFGSVALLSGAGDKVTGSLNATVAGRLADDTWNGGQKWNGVNFGLAVGLNF